MVTVNTTHSTGGVSNMPIGSGDSTTDLDKPITSMTIGEIKQAHAEKSFMLLGVISLLLLLFRTANLIGLDVTV